MLTSLSVPNCYDIWGARVIEEKRKDSWKGWEIGSKSSKKNCGSQTFPCSKPKATKHTLPTTQLGEGGESGLFNQYAHGNQYFWSNRKCPSRKLVCLLDQSSDSPERALSPILWNYVLHKKRKDNGDGREVNWRDNTGSKVQDLQVAHPNSMPNTSRSQINSGWYSQVLTLNHWPSYLRIIRRGPWPLENHWKEQTPRSSAAQIQL